MIVRRLHSGRHMIVRFIFGFVNRLAASDIIRAGCPITSALDLGVNESRK